MSQSPVTTTEMCRPTTTSNTTHDDECKEPNESRGFVNRPSRDDEGAVTATVAADKTSGSNHDDVAKTETERRKPPPLETAPLWSKAVFA